MSDGPFCSLCGGRFREYQGDDDPPPEPLLWATLARSLRGPDNLDKSHAPEISGLGCMTPSGIDARWCYKASFSDQTSEHELEMCELRRESSGLRLFAFHEFCWQTLLRRLVDTKDDELDPEQVSYWLFQVLSSVPWDRLGGYRRVLLPDHHYYGALNLRQSTNIVQDLLAHPNEPPSWIHGISFEELGLDIASRLKIRPPNLSAQDDPFLKFPNEIVHMILSLLKSQDVCSAKLSSRRLAILGSIHYLPQTFWASRFSVDQEMGFAFREQYISEIGTDWLRLYFECKWILNTQSDAQGFRNRRRIWRCLDDLSNVINALHSHGQQEEYSGAAPPGHLGQRVACPQLPVFSIDKRRPVIIGVRIRNEQTLNFNICTEYHGTLLEVSTISLAAGEFISGFRVSTHHPSNQTKVGQQVGLIMPSNLASIHLDPGNELSRIDVYLSTSGIHALDFFITRSDRTAYIQKVGNGRYSAGLVAVTKLIPQSTISGLKIGFDVE